MKKTSWTSNELEKLCNPDNHKITYDRYQYRWYHNINGKWEIHSIKCFENYKQPYSLLQYNLAKWNKELMSRRFEQARNKRMVQRKIELICGQQESATAVKVLEIHRMNPSLTQVEISRQLDVSQQLVYKYLKRAA